MAKKWIKLCLEFWEKFNFQLLLDSNLVPLDSGFFTTVQSNGDRHMLKHADGQRNVFRIGSFNFGVRKPERLLLL